MTEHIRVTPKAGFGQQHEKQLGTSTAELAKAEFRRVYGTPDPVNHPSHYTAHPSGIECITITEHFNFNIGNAIKYLWRAGEKGATLQDLQKAAWYVNREIERLTNA